MMQFTILKEATDRVGRVYNLEELRSQIQTKIDGFGAFGEFYSSSVGDGIDLSKISHRITSVSIEGNDLVASIEFLNTPMGLVARSVYEQSPDVFATSLRCKGQMNGWHVTDFEFVAIDMVINTSMEKTFTV